jgi:hypothetical protein
MYNSGPVAKYGVALKYRMDQHSTVVKPLCEVHSLIKAHIGTAVFTTLLPKTTKAILAKMHKTDKSYPLDLFDQSDDTNETARVRFFELAAEKLDEIAIFGGSEEEAADHQGKSKMVSFSDGISKKDGKEFEKAWLINLAASTKWKKAGEVLYHKDPETDENMRQSPVFDFTVCEGPEHDFSMAEDIPNEKLLALFGPAPGEPFTREGVAVVSLQYIHVRDDETQISVNMSLEHFHAFSRDISGSSKRKFSVISDPDTPQDVSLNQDDAERESIDGDDASGSE